MGVLDLFSKRESRRERQGQEDVFQYDELPQPVRVQVIHIWADAISLWHGGNGYTSPLHDGYPPNMWWFNLHKALAREKGVFQLSEHGCNPFEKVQYYFLEAGASESLDVIELTFRIIDRLARRLDVHERNFFHLTDPDAAIRELNTRFREHGIGYAFEGGQIVRKDSEYLHAETVKPALQLLSGAGPAFSGPLEEFLKAHEHHRKGDQKEAIINAAKAFESTLKAICTARGWAFDPPQGHREATDRNCLR